MKSIQTLDELFWRLPEPWIPHNFQKKAVQFLLTHAAGGLFLDPGLGKTTIVLATLKMLFKQKHIKKVLVVAPLRVCFSTWPGEIEKWADFNHLRYVVLHGPNKDALLEEEADIYIINPEGLDWLLQTTKTRGKNGKTSVDVNVRRFKRLGFDVLVLDELTKFKNQQSDRFKALKLVLNTFGRRWGLTGSPAANGLEQLFGQMFCLDMGRSLGAYITHYRRDHFIPAYSGFGYQLAEGHAEQIYARIEPVVLRIGAEGNIDMPQLVINDVWVDLPEPAMDTYLTMEDDLISQFEGDVYVAKNAGVALGKCRQMANGAIYKTPDVVALVKLPKSQRDWGLLHDVKLEALEDLIESLQGQQVLVTYEFGHDMDRLEKIWPKDRYVAKIPVSKFQALNREWNDGKLERVFAQSSSISHGLNLQERGHHIAMLGCPWDYEVYDQVIRRVLRQGNKAKRVFIHRILAKNTVDHAVVATLAGKEKTQKSLFDALIKLRKTRLRSKKRV